MIGSDYDSFIQKQLNDNDSNWRICSWHNDMKAMQSEVKPNETGWEVYESCKNGGAIIANAHAHSYARSKTLIDFENQIVDQLPTQPWDHPVDLVLTAQRLISNPSLFWRMNLMFYLET